MGLTLTLSDTEIPASPAFVEFLHAAYSDTPFFTGQWYAQEEESMNANEGRFDDLKAKVRYIIEDENARTRVVQAYRYFKEMLTGRIDTLAAMARYRFCFVIGFPRTGGTYLTKQLFRACDIDYRHVQNALAHDGFPHIAPLAFAAHGNLQTSGLLQLAEYMVMVDVFFGERGKLAREGRIVVPKKFTKGVYNFPLIKQVFGDAADYLITLRHPLSIIQSVLDKAGGMTVDRKFAQRSAIERWAIEDWMRWHVPEESVRAMKYVEAMAGYWKRYHFQIAMETIPAMRSTILIPYGAESMSGAVESLFKTFGVELEPEPFKSAPAPEFAADEEAAADQALEEVALFWRDLGQTFPKQALADRA